MAITKVVLNNLEEIRQAVPFIYCACGCQQTRPLYDIRNRIRKYITGHYQAITTPKGSDHYLFKTGYSLTSQGYIINNRTEQLQHREVYEQYYQCCLLPWGEVHHINHIKTDNRPENLIGIMKIEHRRLHHPILQRPPCSICSTSESSRWYRHGQDGYICSKCYKKRRKS